ncbi:MAG TPA: hypothetical protein VFX28_12925, partial [Methylomirabilota bacterium]|nr:hypothetical protein [Methylomirabilota bacterium]
MNRALAGLAMVAPLVAGCAARGTVSRLQQDVGALSAEVTYLRQSQEANAREAARTTAELRSLEARDVEVQAALRAATSELARLRDRLESVERESRAGRAPAPAAPPAPAPPAVTPGPPPAAPPPQRP